jgi:hypothetical protein
MIGPILIHDPPTAILALYFVSSTLYACKIRNLAGVVSSSLAQLEGDCTTSSFHFSKLEYRSTSIKCA